MKTKYLHTMVRVKDLDVSIAFYELLGLKKIRHYDSEQGRFSLIFMAPEGQDAFYVLVPVPNNLSKVKWIEEGDKFKDLVLDKMDKTVLPGIKENVVSDFYLTPDYFEIDLATLYGSGFSIQPKFSQSAYFRFHNQSEIYKKLILCGCWYSPRCWNARGSIIGKKF